VVNDNAGNLSGYAWGENVGWISFSCENLNTCEDVAYGVNIDPVTGIFSGFAYGENIGWISFSDDAPVAYQVQTDDGDEIGGAEDNCPFDANLAQDNNDRNFIELGGFGKLYDDTTVPHSDEDGDPCDADDDNDGFTDEEEVELGPGGAHHDLCPTATGNTDPLLGDSDGDLVLDQAECRRGYDPANSLNTPPFLESGVPDTDADGLPDALEAEYGTDPELADSDGDKMVDGVEFRAYNTDPLVANTDGDACNDAKEAASINADTNVNSIDLQQTAESFGPRTNPLYIENMDVNKDGNINSLDLFFIAANFNPC
jgi:hypothetical protein